MKNTLALVIVAVLTLCSGNRVWALGQEDFGNASLNEANFQEWPGIVPLVNHSSRVYHSWINGNEHCYYRGDVAALNDALRKFAASKADVHEVLLRPAPCTVESFNRAKTVTYNWHLHMVGGIARHLTTLDLGGKVWSTSPTMTVCVGAGIDLQKIEIPQGVTIVELANLSGRYQESFASQDQMVRKVRGQETATGRR